MPKPLEICLEELTGDPDEENFVRCVALPGDEPGLALDRSGAVQWLPEGPGAFGLWVSADDQLVLLRDEGAGPIAVERASRVVQAPVGQPVILRDQDLLRLADRCLRVHVHGQTEAVYPPERLGPSAFGRLARAAAAAATLALGGATAVAAGAHPARTAVGEPAPIEVRHRPPKPARPRVELLCTITRQRATHQRPLHLEATCDRAEGLHVGLYGQILDPRSGNPLPQGAVTVKTVTGKRITVEAKQLHKPVSAKKIRFWVRDW